jgi:Bacterial Ig-like domain (group 3)
MDPSCHFPGKVDFSDVWSRYVRGSNGRCLRLELVVAGLGIALALPALGLPAGESPGLGTQTTLATQIHDQNGITQATLSMSVTGRDGLPATGGVIIQDEGKPIAGVALNSEGRAVSTVTLAPGEHHLRAVYAGDQTHPDSVYQGSVSEIVPVAAQTGTTPDFSIAVAPASLTLAQGQSGTVIASITPINASSLTAPMFVAMSCAGLPDQSQCTFTPANLQILPNATAAVTSSMVITTVLGSQSRVAPLGIVHAQRIAWCVLLPGAFGLAGLAFGTRRSAWLSRLSLLGLIAVVTMLGTTGCSPLYNYRNHGPSPNRPTPAGNYTLNVTAQSSNGITATTHTTTMLLTVMQ